MANVIMTIEPYWHIDTWVFDDESVGLVKEPFVQGVPAMIDALVQGIPNARSGFRLLFSSMPFSGHQEEFTRVKKEYDGYWYRVKGKGVEGWLCPALFKYFEHAPLAIFVKAESISSKHESSEVAILKDRIETLEKMVNKLTQEKFK